MWSWSQGIESQPWLYDNRVKVLLERLPAKLTCPSPAVRLCPYGATLLGFISAPSLSSGDQTRGDAWGRLLASSPFPPGVPRMEAQMPHGGYMDLALETTSAMLQMPGVCASPAPPPALVGLQPGLGVSDGPAAPGLLRM